MPTLQIIIASTRPGRVGEPVADWFSARAEQHGAFELDVVDLAELALPFMDEPNHPRLRRYEHQHTKEWSARVDAADAFALVTPEYNHSYNAPLKNAIDFLHAEWRDKAIGFVSYGGAGGARAVEQLRLMCGALEMADVTPQVTLSLMTEFEDFTVFRPGEYNVTALDKTLDQVVAWSTAFAPLRAGSPVAVA